MPGKVRIVGGQIVRDDGDEEAGGAQFKPSSASSTPSQQIGQNSWQNSYGSIVLRILLVLALLMMFPGIRGLFLIVFVLLMWHFYKRRSQSSSFSSTSTSSSSLTRSGNGPSGSSRGGPRTLSDLPRPPPRSS
eukprot:TRINITY_DN525_c2_g1_i2.p1 TRINITY_DN525_c2_g1~~TRINITY_DN525_c2_g1_i2.p1  ORF type:complete len:155 (+),score=35.87 TRINITY_DN525_c2_g1_i2:67-465(+)